MTNNKLSLIIGLSLALLVPILHFTFNFLDIYGKQIAQGNVWVDNILHLLFGLATGLIVWGLQKSHSDIIEKRLFVVLLITILLAFIWEIFEYILLLSFTEYSHTYKIYSSSISEAFSDICYNIIGVGLLILYKLKFYFPNK